MGSTECCGNCHDLPSVSQDLKSPRGHIYCLEEKYLRSAEKMTSIYDTEFDINCAGGITSAPCAAYIGKITNSVATEQMNRKDAAMTSVMAFSQRIYDADRNATIAQTRSNDLKNALGSIDGINAAANNGLKSDLDVTRRQFEINEYHYYNKLDTLFFLQLLFISVLVMAILIYFNRRGTLTTKMTGILTAILAVLLIVIGVSRYFYTERTRDRRLWHRRYFQSEKDPGPDLITRCPGPSSATEVNLNALFDKQDIACAIETKDAIKAWAKSANDEAKAQMNTSAIPISVFSQFGYTKPASCNRR